MKTVKKILFLVPLLVLWLMFSIFLWGFVFAQITDAPPEQKIVVCVDGETPGGTELAVQLEEKLAGKVRMVKVRPFSYAMLDSRSLTGADLYLVPASHVETYLAWFAPLPGEMRSENDTLVLDGTPFGILAYNAETGEGIATDCIRYVLPGEGAENYYLLFGKESVHLLQNEKAADNTAVEAALRLFGLYK